MPNPSKEPPASSKASYEDLKDMDVLCTFKIRIESQNLDHRCIKDQWPYPKQDQDAKPQAGASSILQCPNQDLKDLDILCTFKVKIAIQNLKNMCIKDQLPYPNQDEDAKLQLETSSFLQSSNWDSKEMDVLWTIKINLDK